MRIFKKSMVRMFTSSLIMMQLFAGCMNMRVVSQYDSSNPVPEKVTRWTWFWGLKQPVDVKTGQQCSSICMLTVKNNLGYAIIATLSLGIAVPMTVEYSCCPFNPEPADF